MADFEDDDPFTAPDGSVWQYQFIANPHRTEETLFAVLPVYRQSPGAYPTKYRQCMIMSTGELEWFAAGSPAMRHSKRIS